MDLYLEFVFAEAQKLGKLFIIDSGEGNDFIDPSTGWYIEDLSGWLINPNEKKFFLLAKKNNTVHSKFSDVYVFVKWSKTENDKLQVQFKRYIKEIY